MQQLLSFILIISKSLSYSRALQGKLRLMQHIYPKNSKASKNKCLEKGAFDKRQSKICYSQVCHSKLTFLVTNV